MSQATKLDWDDVVYVSGLVGRMDLNNRAARIIAPVNDKGRMGVEFMIGMERVRVKLDNLTKIESAEDLKREPFCGMSETERTDVAMFFWSNEGSVKVAPGLRVHNIAGRAAPPAPPPAPPPTPCPPGTREDFSIDDLMCEVCTARPCDIYEYIQAAEDNNTTPEQYVIDQEGTYNEEQNIFWCTQCYIRIGSPPGKAGQNAKYTIRGLVRTDA